MIKEIQLLKNQITKLENAQSVLQDKLLVSRNREKKLERSLMTREGVGLEISKKPDFIFEMNDTGTIIRSNHITEAHAYLSSVKNISDLLNEEQSIELFHSLREEKYYSEFHFSLIDKYIPYKNIQLIILRQESSSLGPCFLVSAFLTISNIDKKKHINQFKELFLNFSDDYMANINHLAALLGSLLNASVTLYNRLDEGMLISWGQWNTPDDYQAEDKPEGHLCYDVIRGDKDKVLLVRDLQNTKYAKSDPNVVPYKLQTYIGYPVSNSENQQVGSICAVFQSDFIPKENDIKLLQIIAQAISSEEKRMLKEKELFQRGNLLAAINKINEQLLKNEKEINFKKICSIIGNASKFNSVRIFQNLSKGLENLQIEEIASWGKTQSGKIVFNNICKIQNALKWKNVFLKGEPIAVTNKDFPDKISQVFTSNGVQSFLLNPIILDGKIKYFLLIINSVYEHKWSKVEKDFSKTISREISDHLLTRKLKNAIEEDNLRFTTVMNNLNSSVFVSDMNTYKLLYVNKYVENQIKGIEGKYCYNLVMGEKAPCKVCKKQLLIDDHEPTSSPQIWRHFNKREKKWYLTENQAVKWQNGQLACLSISTDITQLVQQEDELKLQKEKITDRRNFYRRLLDNSSDLVWAKDKKGRFLFANKAIAEKLLIADIKEIKGQTSEYFANRQKSINPTNKNYHTFGDTNIKSDKLVLEQPHINHHYDEFGNVQGKFLYLDVHKSPLYDNNKKLVGIVGSGRIVTKEKQAEHKLFESETKYKYLVENTMDVIAQISITGTLLYVSPNTYRFGGYHPNEEIGFHISKYFYNKIELSKALFLLKEVLIYKKPGVFEFFYKHRSGKKIPAEVGYAPIIKNGKVNSIHLVIRNISFRKDAQLKIKESELKLKEAQSIAKLGHWEYDLEKELIHLSDEVFNIYEIKNTGKAWKVETFFKYVHPSDKPIVRHVYIESMKNSKEYIIDHRVVLNGNKLKYVSQKAYHIHNKEGRVIKTIGTIQDITSIKETELALQAHKEKLTELNNKLLQKVHKEVEKSREKDRILLLQSRQASMGEMIENIAHQWRQPLNEISLLLGDMEDAYQYNELSKEYFDKAITQANSRISYMSQTIDDFRNYFIDKSKNKEFDVATTIKRSIKFVQNNFRRKGIHLTYNLQDGLMLNGQCNLLSQAILNILNNAKDVFRERKTQNPEINIVLSSKDKELIIEITDNAGGIDKNIIDKIFDPYFTTKGEKSGTGLGLYIANTIIHKQLGGVLFAKNNKNGASFIIEF